MQRRKWPSMRGVRQSLRPWGKTEAGRPRWQLSHRYEIEEFYCGTNHAREDNPPPLVTGEPLSSFAYSIFPRLAVCILPLLQYFHGQVEYVWIAVPAVDCAYRSVQLCRGWVQRQPNKLGAR